MKIFNFAFFSIFLKYIKYFLKIPFYSTPYPLCSIFVQFCEIFICLLCFSIQENILFQMVIRRAITYTDLLCNPCILSFCDVTLHKSKYQYFYENIHLLKRKQNKFNAKSCFLSMCLIKTKNSEYAQKSSPIQRTSTQLMIYWNVCYKTIFVVSVYCVINISFRIMRLFFFSGHHILPFSLSITSS